MSTDFEIALHDSKNPFKNLNTEKKRFAEYRRKCGYLDPIEFCASLIDNPMKETQDIVQGVHLPLGDQIKIYLELPGVYSEILKYEEKVTKLYEEKGFVSNVINSQLWINYYKPKFEGRVVHPLFLFFDDMDPTNCQRSHAQGQKLGCTYVSLPTLPPHLRVKLKNIIITTIFYGKNREISKNEVFKKIIMELNILSTHGLKVNIDQKPVTVYFQCVSLLGDNLGLNQICGFMANFSANYYCRICRMHKDECKVCPVERLELLRTVENYEEDLLNSEHDIKGPCIFHDIFDFHIIRNPTLDLMHDMSEGTATYVSEGVLVQKIITIDEVNLEMKNFRH